ncbi:AtpZ/AtpI family protein [Candidatus Parcubacteria bacterium]|nr:AtpZ/AtpI family protein [Candidatus Parcubacteria bacterium]
MGSEKNNWWQPGVELFLKLSGWIAVPIIAAIFLGKWLDDKYGTEPKLFLLSVFIAFIISNIGIVYNAIRAMKDLDNLSKNKKDEPDSKQRGTK